MKEQLKFVIIFCYLCLTIFVFKQSFLYGNPLPNTTEPSTRYMRDFSNRGVFNFSSQSIPLSHLERRLIIINADTHIPIDSVTDFLQHHKQVVYFERLAMDSDYLDRSHALDLCFSIFECSPHHLSYFVDYANDKLLSGDQPRLCGGNRRHQHVQLNLNNTSQPETTYNTCQPASKTQVTHFCQNHHLAFRIPLAYVKKLKDKLTMSSVRVVSVTELDNKHSLSADSFNASVSHLPPPVDNVPEYNELKFNSADLYPHVHKIAFLELLNFLDLYEPDFIDS